MTATGFAEELAECGGLAARLLDVHVDDGSGRCAVCWVDDHSCRLKFPCNIRTSATRALHIQAGRELAGKILPKGPGPVA